MIETYTERQKRLLLPHAIGQRCSLCGVPMTTGQANAWLLTLDTQGDHIVHGWCNGARQNVADLVRRTQA